MRATAQNRVASSLVGIRVGRMLALGWALSSMVGAVAGMLLAPTLFLSPSMMVGVLLFAFAAAVLGGLESPVGAIVGGLTIGVVQNMAGTYIPSSNIDITVAFCVIIVILLVRPHGLFGRKAVCKESDGSRNLPPPISPPSPRVCALVAIFPYLYRLPVFSHFLIRLPHLPGHATSPSGSSCSWA